VQDKLRLLSIVLILLLAFGQVVAQDGETFTGELEDDRDENEHEIELEEGDSVLITAVATSGSELDTILSLENEDGDEVAYNDDYEFPTSTNSQFAYTAEDDGEYTIIISAYSGSSGEYEITVEFITLGEPDLEFEGYMGDDVDDDEYEIDLDEGDGVIISLEAASGSDLDTVLALLDEDGNEVAFNDDRASGDFNSEIVYVAEEDGEYTIIVSNYPDSSGDYVLTVTFVSGEEAEQFGVTSGGSTRPEVDTTPERDPDETYEGTIDSDEEPDEYEIELEEGDFVIAAMYETDGEMDTLLYVLDPDGNEIARNDDRGDYSTFNSQVAFEAEEDGEYTIVASNYPEYPGDYTLEIYFADEDEYLLAAQAMRVLLSGPVEFYDTDNFRIHYTLEGVDATDEDYVEEVGEIMEEILVIQTEELGWALPPSDGSQGGDSRYDVYLINQDGIYGYASSSSAEGDNPNTSFEEEHAQAAFLVLDNDYAEFDDAERALYATAAHEFHHVIQYGYDSSDWNWYYEATASWMETVTYPDEELASIYVDNVYGYPEACFGGDGDADPSGGGIYGTWLFFEFMARELDDDAPVLLWDYIAEEDGWEPLELTLEEYDETIESFVAQYHINNLMRDYEFVDSFEGATVWLEETIDDEGDWEASGDGIQELGANYFFLDVSDDVYTIEIDDDELQLFVIGINGDDAEVYGGDDEVTIDTDDYDDVYIMVFNPDYDNDILECEYTEYEITVEASSDDVDDVIAEVDASEFEDLD